MTTILVEKNVMAPMRGGVRLATDIYRREGATPTPVLVARTPYNKDGMVASGDVFNILRAVQAGYTVMVQDVRGRYAPEGIFHPHIQETDDGIDMFTRTVIQSWSNGISRHLWWLVSGCDPVIACP